MSCCLGLIPMPAECRRLVKAAAAQLVSVWKRVWRGDQRSCGTKVAVCACKTATNFLVSLLSIFLLWLVFFLPYRIRPTTGAAVLSIFDLDANNGADTLSYKLALDLAFFNDHRVYSVRFDHLTAAIYYNGTKLGGSSSSNGDGEFPGRFTLRPRQRRTVHPVLQGRASNVGGAVAEEFSREKKPGRFTVEVVVKTTLTYKFWPTKAVYYHEYSCWLTFPDPARAADHDAQEVTGRVVRCGVAR